MSAAMTARRPNRGLAGGWLSMAPEPERQQQQQPQNDRQSPPSRRATFQLGASADDDGDDTTDIDTPVTPQSGQGSSSVMTPAFDVRASFAPMTFKRPAGVATKAAQQPQPDVQVQQLSQSAAASTASTDTDMLTAQAGAGAAYLRSIVDDGHGIQYGGRRWKGKTAHAVEQEMEMAGDTTVMSYAPDAVYLASRLEGLRRNIEVGGDAVRGRRWIGDGDGDGDDDDKDEDEDVEMPLKSAAAASHSPSSPALPRTPDDRRPATLPPHITDLIPATVGPSDSSALAPLSPSAKAAALESRVEIRLLRRSDLEQVRDLHCLHGDSDKTEAEHYVTSAAFLLRLLVDEAHVCLVAVAKPIPAPAEPFPIGARAHQGDNETGDGAAHPHPHPSHRVPRCPPPSMDMPPSAAPYVFASKGIATNSPFLSPADADARHKRRRKMKDGGGQLSAPSPMAVPAPPPPSAKSASSLGRHTPVLGSMAEEDEEDEDEGGDSDSDSNAASPSSSPLSPSPSSSPSSLSTRLDGMDVDSSGGGGGGGGGVAPASAAAGPSSLLHPRRVAHPAAAAAAAAAAASSSPSSSTGMAPKRDYATTDMILAGPTDDVGPPRALRVMVPPAPGATAESEQILGVASAQITLRTPTESLWGDADEASSRPHKEIHVLTLSVAKAERGLGLGGKLLDQLIAEAQCRNIGAAYRAAMGQRRLKELGPTRTYLQVHAEESTHAIRLYRSKGFVERRRLQGYFRGDVRIPAAVRSMPGGNDALLMERHEMADAGDAGA